MKKTVIFILLSLSLLSFSYASEKFSVVVGLAKPPYVIQSENSGFEIEMIRAILTRMSLQPEFIYVPYGRSSRMLKSKRVDAIMTANVAVIQDESLLTDPYIIYQNIVITLKENHIEIIKIEDLAKLSIIAFQSANKILGTIFEEIISKNYRYLEVSNQFKQTKSLFNKETSALIMDINIFRAIAPTSGGKGDYSDVDFHYIFDKNPYKLAIQNKALIPLFNQELKKFKASDEYQALMTQYQIVQ